MKCWCKLCRKWVYESHFEQLKPHHGMRTRDGCGQGRDDIRYHPENPLVGDVWKVSGVLWLVDYKTSFHTGVTSEAGLSKAQKYTDGFRQWLRDAEAKLVSTFEEWPMSARWCDHRGWTPSGTDGPTAGWPQSSVDFLKFRVGALRKDGVEI